MKAKQSSCLPFTRHKEIADKSFCVFFMKNQISVLEDIIEVDKDFLDKRARTK